MKILITPELVELEGSIGGSRVGVRRWTLGEREDCLEVFGDDLGRLLEVFTLRELEGLLHVQMEQALAGDLRL